ncbi:formylglycine-generating enzyme family protein [Mesorhizobium sp. YM1C-6-2]|uniref:formylglycine-generating enzyme family protein n=1 Tax=Mesorhizobium sp. YM1C-6-2 TaxID=1827501 RepID=UPI001FE0F6D3|nr:formylglycine-generating enzyme family protein [Mesorhizobium sp. YM1C-6-2]
MKLTTQTRAQGEAPLGRDMVWIPGGQFLMGSDHHYPEEAPAHRVRVDGFWIDRFAVTNREFEKFVKETGYVTMAERPVNPDDYPDALPEMLAPSSTVFRKPSGPVDMRNHYNWWTYVPGANWRRPRGPASSIAKLRDHPVVHVALEDVEAYAQWAGMELPTEAEWEFASRGGLEEAEFAWGDDFTPDGVHMANTWQGDFPYRNTLDDRFEYTAPVGSFPANGYGLYDMIGNVWEWTSDWYQEHGNIDSPCCTAANPRGGDRHASPDPRDPVKIPRKVTKGGSHLCAPNYCRRYRPAARMAQPIDTSVSHLGFRLVVRPDADN